MGSEDDPLQALLLDADEVDRTQLAEALGGLLGIDNKTGRVVLKPGFNTLDTRKKVLAFLMGAKVANLLGKSEAEIVSPTELSRGTGMPKGTVNPKLSQLHDQRLISKTKNGAYYLDSHQVPKAAEELRGASERG